MNGPNGANGLPSINVNSTLDLSPLDGPWERASSVSNTLDSIVRLNLTKSLPTEQSVVLFHKLPREVILRILWAVDANGFASLSLTNRAFYEASQSLELYAHHLSRCPSYALSNNVITGPFRKNDLLRLKTKFAAEVRRNLFDAYLRPRETHINLISVNANSSAAFPGGEAFRFEFSPNGQTVLALNSSRIYVLDATGESLEVVRELKTLRRAFTAAVTDDGSLLAVLSSKYQVNIYGLTPDDKVSHLQVIVLDHPPRTIALAHEGTVLAASYEGGIEVFSLAANAMSTDRRAVRSEAVDSLIFSADGSMLVGSSQDLEEPNAVVITAPFYTENDPNITPREIHSRMWTTQILFPQISSTVSHAALLSGHQEADAYWLFAYDHMLDTYRAVRTDDTRTGVAYFLSPPGPDRFEYPSPNIAPTLTSCGTLAVAGFSDNGLFMYGVPERLDISPDMGSVIERNDARLQKRGNAALTSATGHLEPLLAYSPSVSGSSEDIEEDGLAGKVDWRQSLFVKSKHINCIPGFTSAKWIESTEDRPCEFHGKRLIATAPGGVNQFAEELGEESMPVDGSRICLLDFHYGPESTPEKREITIEVGDNEPELLTEHAGNLEVEVAMERRRTVRANRGGGVPATNRAMATGRATTSLNRAVTAAAPPTHAHNHREEGRRRESASQVSSPIDEGISPQTRTSAGLSRSATAAGFYQSRFPPRPPLGTPSFDNPGQGPYGRQAPGRGSVDSWETPPPAYGQGGVPLANSMNNPHRSPNMQPQANSALVADGLQTNNNWASNAMPNAIGRAVATGGGPTYRQSTTFDGMMTSELAPTHRMSQYTGAMRPAQSPTVERGLETVQEKTQTPVPTQRPSSADTPSQVSSFISPMGTADAAFIERTQAVRISNEDQQREEALRLQATMTHPLSPPTPERQGWYQTETPISPPTAVQASSQNRISLTGANLTNRLNHPTPLVPGQQIPSDTYVIPGITPPGPQPPLQSPTTQDGTSRQFPLDGMIHPAFRADPRSVDDRVAAALAHPAMAPPGSGQMPHPGSRDFTPQTQPHPQQRVPTRTTPENPNAHPNPNAYASHRLSVQPGMGMGHAQNHSGSSHPSISHNTRASSSTPNLLHVSRPVQGRFDTANGANGMGPGTDRPHHERERSTSLQDDPGLYDRAATDPIMFVGRKGKKTRKVRTDGVVEEKEKGKKKGLRCVVM